MNVDPGWRRDTIARLVLRLVVRPAADHREDLAGARVERDQRGFGLALPLPARQQLIDVREAVADRILRDTLQVQVERRVHVDRLVVGRRQPRIAFVERLRDVVDEIRRFRFERALDHGQRFLLRGFRLLDADEAGIGHRADDHVAPVVATRGVVERRERRRRLDDPGDCRCFGNREVRDILAEEEPRRFRDADDRERAALPERHGVQVHLEDLVLRRLARQDQRDPHLENLAARGAFTCLLQRPPLELRQEHVVYELLGERARRRDAAVARDAVDDGAGEANRIDARMVVEAPVFDGQHRVDDVWRQRTERDRSSLLTLGLQRAEERRIERQAVTRIVVQLETDDAIGRLRFGWWRGGLAARLRRRWRRHLERHLDAAPLELRGSRRDDDLIVGDRELARLGDAGPLGVADVVQPIDQLPFAQRLPRVDFERTREDAREHALPFAVQLPIDQAAERDVVITGDGREEDERDRDDKCGDADPPASQERDAPGRTPVRARW
ncbi:MAG: hypothetical protein QM736_18710 [Vicinamibacterales bacterium]